MSVNKVTLLGYVCADPKITTFDNGGKTAQFSLATNERAFKTKDGKEIPERTEFHNLVLNRKGLVSFAEGYIKKGSRLYVEGMLRTRSYEDKNGKHYITEIYVSTLENLTPKDGETAKAAPQAAPAPAPASDDDDLPF